jgi:hypothetical protein
MELSSLLIAIAALILLAVTAMRYGVDSRAGFASKERELAARGIVWGTSPAARDRQMAGEVRAARRRRQGAACATAVCGA